MKTELHDYEVFRNTKTIRSLHRRFFLGLLLRKKWSYAVMLLIRLWSFFVLLKLNNEAWNDYLLGLEIEKLILGKF